MNSCKKLNITYCFLRSYSVKIKPKVVPDENVLNNIDNSTYNPKNHPGIFKPRLFPIPTAFLKAVENVVADYPIKSLLADGEKLIHKLKGKRPPVEKQEQKMIRQNVYESVVSRTKIPEGASEEKQIILKAMIDNKVNMILKKEVYNWKPVNYDDYTALVYLLARSAAEYSVLTRIFLEISKRDPEFKPRSLFDFGSGVGTVTWAATQFWKKHIFEYYNVDSSQHMNDLAQILLQNGKGTNKMELRGVFHRQFLPASNNSYDLVVSAYSLLELPSRQSRLETVLNLWNKTHKYFVVVEQGTNAGFQVINEVRDFILQAKNSTSVGHVFSPCPHDSVCPRFRINDGTPCNFETHYFSLPMLGVSHRHAERFSYVVLKKGERDASDPQWPRIVRDTLIRSKHTICRMCTKNAELEEVIFTAAKHGKNMYRCARATTWGEIVPVALENQTAPDDQQE